MIKRIKDFLLFHLFPRRWAIMHPMTRDEARDVVWSMIEVIKVVKETEKRWS